MAAVSGAGGGGKEGGVAVAPPRALPTVNSAPAATAVTSPLARYSRHRRRHLRTTKGRNSYCRPPPTMCPHDQPRSAGEAAGLGPEFTLRNPPASVNVLASRSCHNQLHA